MSAVLVPDFERAAPPVQDRAHRTRDRLLDVAGALLGQIGIERISTNLVAQHAGMTPPALYRHFRNKYDLLAALSERLMQRQNQVLIDWLDRWQGSGQAGLTAHLADLFRETARATDAEPGGVWIERALRAVPQLAPIRVASHRYVTDRITAVMAELAPEQDAGVLWRRVRLAVELGYAVDEMLHEEDRIDREDLFAEAARAIEAIFATRGEGHDGD
jgi:AcrR family transcriptional regulator